MNRPEDPALLAAGADTGWWNDAGTPAPWPENFPQNWRPDTHDPAPEPGEPAF